MCAMQNKEELLIDVLDDDGIRTGETCSRKEIHKLGKIHRAIHLYLFDESNRLLLQRRSIHVDHYPGMFSISLTGHVDAGERSSEALHREIREELGFDPRSMKIDFLFSFKQNIRISPDYIDHQFNDIYACWYDFNIGDVLFDLNAINEVKLVSCSEFKAMIANRKTIFAQIYSREGADMMYFLRSRLDSIVRT